MNEHDITEIGGMVVGGAISLIVFIFLICIGPIGWIILWCLW